MSELLLAIVVKQGLFAQLSQYKYSQDINWTFRLIIDQSNSCLIV